MLKFILFWVISLVFAYIAHFIFYKYNYWGNYMHVISVGIFAYLPFLALQDKLGCFWKCFALFFPVVLSVYLPIFIVPTSILSKASAAIYMVFLGLAMCRHRFRVFKMKQRGCS